MLSLSNNRLQRLDGRKTIRKCTRRKEQLAFVSQFLENELHITGDFNQVLVGVTEID